IGRDVGMRPLKDHQYLVAALNILPDRIVSCHVRMQRSVLALFGLEFEGQVIGVVAARTIGKQDAERVLGDEPMQDVGRGFVEMIGYVHDGLPGNGGVQRTGSDGHTGGSGSLRPAPRPSPTPMPAPPPPPAPPPR